MRVSDDLGLERQADGVVLDGGEPVVEGPLDQFEVVGVVEVDAHRDRHRLDAAHEVCGEPSKSMYGVIRRVIPTTAGRPVISIASSTPRADAMSMTVQQPTA